MNMKEHILTALREQFNSWEQLLARMSEEQITAPHLFRLQLVYQGCDGSFVGMAAGFHCTDGSGCA